MQKEPIIAENVYARKGQTNYPEPYAQLVSGRTKRKLGDYFGITNFGVNLTTLEPGSISSLFHHHSSQDEFIYVLKGEVVLRLGDREYSLQPGDCVGLPAGTGTPHQLVNRSSENATYLEIGDRSSGDEVNYPNDPIKVRMDSDGHWVFE